MFSSDSQIIFRKSWNFFLKNFIEIDEIHITKKEKENLCGLN